MQLRHPGCGGHLLLAGGQVTEVDVVADGIMEVDAVLRQHGHASYTYI